MNNEIKFHILFQITMSTTNNKSDENFSKEFLRDFYRNIIDKDDDFLTSFENTLNEWIKDLGKNTKAILELMQNHKESEFWFSGIIGFFYQCGIGCNIDKNHALELYLLTVNNERSLNKQLTNLHLLEKDDNQFDD